MLTSAQFDELVTPITDLYAEFEQSIIEDIARRLANFDIDSAAWQAQRIIESGALYKDVLKRLSELTGMSEKTIADILKQAGVKAMRFDDKIYKAAGLNPLPLNLSPAMLKVLLANITKTNGLIHNLTMTTASAAQQSFIRALDIAHLQVATGTMSYDQAIRSAIKKLAKGGLDVVNYPSGHTDKLDVAIRRAVLTSIGQTAAQLQLTRADEMGQDLVEVSAHEGARNTGEGVANHESWQGKVYSRTKTHTEYEGFVEKTGYGTGAGLAGWNCRHNFYPFFEGLSERMYNEDELIALANKKVTYNGKEMSEYEASQIQRGIERKIREWKREEAGLKAAGLDSSFERGKLKDWQARMRDFIKQTGLRRQSVREGVVNGGVSTAEPEITQPDVVPNDSGAIGVPVSNALDTSAIRNANVKEQIELALAMIDKVHGDGVLSTIPMQQSKSRRTLGSFYSSASTPFQSRSRALRIEISSAGKEQALTTIHEVGHFIDHSGLGVDKMFSSQISGVGNNAIIEVAKKSKWWTIFENTAKEMMQRLGNQFNYDYYYYLKRDKEIFARAYAQFIAIESGNPVLLAQLKEFQDSYLPILWSDEDFEQIAEMFRKIFREQGWMK